MRTSWKKYGGLWADGVASTVVTVGARAPAHINLKSSDNFYYAICYCTYIVSDTPGFYNVLYLVFQGFLLPWIKTSNPSSSSSFLIPARFGLGCNMSWCHSGIKFPRVVNTHLGDFESSTPTTMLFLGASKKGRCQKCQDTFDRTLASEQCFLEDHIRVLMTRNAQHDRIYMCVCCVCVCAM